MRFGSIVLASCLVACGGEPRPAEPAPRTRLDVAPAPAASEPAPEATAEATAEVTVEPATPAEPAEDPFAAPLPTEACPSAVRVAIAHASTAGLPSWLERAVAFRSEDRRHLRIAIANHALDLDAAGRFAAPAPGEARFEMDATRTRRGPLAPRVLGAPDSRHGGLTHARIVSTDALLTFGHRNLGQVELTEITDEHVCGRVELDDGFGRVRGAFRADIVGPLPE